MLMLTFQPIYDKEEIAQNRHLRSQGRYDASGYAMPVWCCGGDNLAEIFVSAFFTAPRFPDQVIFFETDDFVRVDKDRWYKHVRDGRKFSADLLNPDLPNPLCEFITDADIMTNTTVAQISLLNLQDEFDNNDIAIDVQDEKLIASASQEQIENMFHLMMNCFERLEGMAFGNLFGNVKYKQLVHTNRLVFLFGMLPLIYSLLSNTVQKNIEFAIYPMFDKIMNIYSRRFYPWQDGEHASRNANELKAIMRDTMKCVITEPVALSAIQQNNGELDKRLMSSKCPCGSNKQFDNCHGKRYR